MATTKPTLTFITILLILFAIIYTCRFLYSATPCNKQVQETTVPTQETLGNQKDRPRFHGTRPSCLTENDINSFNGNQTFTNLLEIGFRRNVINCCYTGFVLDDCVVLSHNAFYDQLISRQGGKLKNVTVDNCSFSNSRISDVVFENCTFTNVYFNQSSVDFDSINSKFDNVRFHQCHIEIPYMLLMQSENYKEKSFSDCVLVLGIGDLPNTIDFSDFTFNNVVLKGSIPSDAIFKNAYFKSVTLGKYNNQFTSSQLKQTRNYQLGIFYKIGFNGHLCEGISFMDMCFIRCSFYQSSMKDVDLTNARFINCDLENVTDLTAEQIRSTWNYKHKYMKGVRLPDHLMSEMSDELKNYQYSFSNKKDNVKQNHNICLSKVSSASDKNDLTEQSVSKDSDYTYDDEKPDFGYTKIVLATKEVYNDYPSSCYELKDGIDLSGRYIGQQVLARQGGTLKNIDFSGCLFSTCEFQEITFENCSFQGAFFNNCRGCIKSINSDFRDATFQDSPIGISYETYLQTRNYKLKRPLFRLYDFDNLPENADMTEFEFTHAYFGLWDDTINISNAYLESIRFADVIDQSKSRISSKQLFTTLNYKLGVFVNSDSWLPACSDNIDFSNMVFLDCDFRPSSVKNSDFTGAKFIDCSLERLTNLTVEQLKSTWNYKNNRMDLIKLPPDLQKYFDEEKKEKE
ncbi:MAG: pentapeptide repeat-containing protein [Thermoguttaceae bacterium]|nr:pentapeptide repeat-containing protein [Thermoguttaceae bacterium]